MTLCIAAPCLEEGNPCIVFAADRRIESGFSSAESGFKLGWVGQNWPAMYAGSVTAAEELINTYSSITLASQFTADNVFDSLKVPAAVHKAKLCDHYVRMKLGMGYQYFLEHGKQQLSETQFRETELEVRQLNLDCHLIMAGFIERRPYVFTLDENGNLAHCDNFATIGTGCLIANSVLNQRNQARYDRLERTVYVVYEAMKLAQNAPGVGQEIIVMIVSHFTEKGDLPIRWVETQALAWLDEHFKNFGPKPLSPTGVPPIPKQLLHETISTPRGGPVVPAASGPSASPPSGEAAPGPRTGRTS